MPPPDRIRLKRNPKNVATPAGGDDLYFNAAGELIHQSPGGAVEVIGAPVDVSNLKYDPAITGLTGGGATKLDGIVTVGVAVGRVQSVRDTSTNQIYQYELIADTGVESSPVTIRPDDYNASTNAKVWALRGLHATQINASTGIYSGGNVTIQNNIVVSGANDAVENSLPDADGVIALATVVVVAEPGTGGTTTATRYVDQMIYGAASGVVESHTLALPASTDARDGQTITFLSIQNFTAITVTAGAGNTMGGTTLSSIVANIAYSFIYVAVVSKWVRIA